MVDPLDDNQRLPFSISPAALDAARDALTHDRPVRASGAFQRGRDATLAPLLPPSMRVASFQTELEVGIRSAAMAGASADTIDALLAVAVHLSERFPDAC